MPTNKNIALECPTSMDKYIGSENPFASLFANMFYNCTRYFEPKQYKEDRKLTEAGKDRHSGYHFIPLSLQDAVGRMFAINTVLNNTDKLPVALHSLDFLDAGCGPGNILLLARYILGGRLEKFHGIELDSDGAHLARILTGAEQPHKSVVSMRCKRYIHNTDIFKFRHYKKFGFIYYYCPIKISPLQALWEEIMEDKLEKGTIIVPNLKKSQIYHKDPRFVKIQIKIKGWGHTRELLLKVNNGKRRGTMLHESDKRNIPKAYHKLFDKHVATHECKRPGSQYY